MQPGDRVAYLGLNSDRYYEYLFAVPWIGAVVNPVNIRWSPAEIGYSLLDSGTRVLLVDDAFAKLLPALQDQFGGLHTVIFTGEGETPPGTCGTKTWSRHTNRSRTPTPVATRCSASSTPAAPPDIRRVS